MQLKAIRRLVDAATPGPWEHVHIFDGEEIIRAFTESGGLTIGFAQYEVDGRFMAAARVLMPLLLDVVDAARAMQDADRSDSLHKALVALEVSNV